MTSSQDIRWLSAAVRLGERQNGQSWPNPAVGCLLVRDDVVVGSGVTGQGGIPHGETRALSAAGDRARGATCYVSLEPCNHHGRTPPCTNALMEAGVKRVVIALGDPDPRVSGSGARRLESAGIEVSFEPDQGCRRAAQRAHRGHIRRMTTKRPFVTLKLALSADGGVGFAEQGQVAITSEQTNKLMHGLRSQMDAIAVGGRTWRLDKPQLNVRLSGLEHRSPQRIVFSNSADEDDVWAFSGQRLEDDLFDISTRGIGTLLLEGGASLANSFLGARLVDELILLRGAPTLGADSLKPFAVNPFENTAGAGLGDWQKIDVRRIGDDTLWVLTPPTSTETQAAA
ncbi:MAG: bifunctional diaminohydroxyphosphoribosylaminopyrimidine deaminase/5-amino-6-(5-phosphoribosylamino)uracil reductase RibD [Pseudomonadota bacterium]